MISACRKYTAMAIDGAAQMTGVHGWCQTWQAFDVECTLMGCPEKHDALRTTAKEQLANPSVEIIDLTALAHCLFWRHVDLFLRCISLKHRVMASRSNATEEAKAEMIANGVEQEARKRAEKEALVEKTRGASGIPSFVDHA